MISIKEIAPTELRADAVLCAFSFLVFRPSFVFFSDVFGCSIAQLFAAMLSLVIIVIVIPATG